MNILIADSGSTKTIWALIEKENTFQTTTEGINPYYQDKQAIVQTILEVAEQSKDYDIEKIYFFGAGCSNKTQQNKVESAIQVAFPNTQIRVAHDMLGAAIGLCKREEGIACILGTGANACLYDGTDIIKQAPNYGFWLGDEGSGGNLGKKLIIDYLHHDMPKALRQVLQYTYQLERDVILEQAYQKNFPNRYFAQFSKFLKEHLEETYCQNLVANSFNEFFEKYIKKLATKWPLFFVGSVAVSFEEILRSVAKDHDFNVALTEKDPIEGLIQYYQQEITFHK
ncbi:MAG: N-acetylglucosamine kinase [Bacteroidota bacterium]